VGAGFGVGLGPVGVEVEVEIGLKFAYHLGFDFRQKKFDFSSKIQFSPKIRFFNQNSIFRPKFDFLLPKTMTS
jgi:hypothetical protein